MKITRRQLRSLIKEELGRMLNEGEDASVVASQLSAAEEMLGRMDHILKGMMGSLSVKVERGELSVNGALSTVKNWERTGQLPSDVADVALGR
tara:strand:+ start:252 stop:530 length:279 start_codon:yes stop_codon:yes gene_type:complete